MSMSYIMNNNVISCFVDGTLYTIDTEHPCFNEIKEAIKNDDVNSFLELAPLTSAVEVAVTKMGSDKIVCENGVVKYNGRVLHSTLADRIVQMSKEGFSIEPMIKFLENLLQNPSRASVEELYDFLANKNLPITEDGHFLAYKAVRQDYMDKHSGKYLNTIGEVIEMPRNEVDDDRRNECSYGFHVGALEYSGPEGYFFNQGDHCMITKVNPRDVVAVPKDYNFQKMRVCRYEVVAEYNVPLKNSVYGNEAEELEPDYEDEDFSLDYSDIYAGDTLSFDYCDSFGKCSHRTGVLVDDTDEDHIIGLEYDSSTGKTKVRRFNFTGMSNIYYDE